MDNKEYWIDRAERTFLAGEKSAFTIAKELQNQYKQAINTINKELKVFYTDYLMDLNDASERTIALKKYLDNNELKAFKEELVQYYKDAKKLGLDEKYLKKLKKTYNNTRITRLEELKVKIQFEIEKLTNNNEQQITELLKDTYEEGYYQTIFSGQQMINYSFKISPLNVTSVEKAISTKYLSETFKTRLYKNEQNLMYILEQSIPQGLILGYSPKRLASMTSKKLDTNYNNTVRLIRTEYNKILNDATLEGYKQQNIQKYQILATLDHRTSDICRDMDNRVFDITKVEIGVNYPPFHPNCRTTTIPYFEPDEFSKFETRIAKDRNNENYYVPANISYEQWQEGLYKTKDGKIRYKNK